MKKRILELDAFRGIAAVMVVCFHYVMNTEFGHSIFKVGVTGVDLFYLISGYVIFMTVEGRENWKNFIVSRFSRLYPPFWSALLFTSALYLIFKKDTLTPVMFIGNLTMIPHILGIEEIDHSYWSLAVEVVFYVLILIALLTKQIKNIEKWSAVGLVLLVLFHFVSPLLHVEGLLFKISYRIEFLNQAPLFIAGIIFYKMHHERPTLYRHLLVLCSFVLACFMHPKGRALQHISFTEHTIMLMIYFAMFYLFIYGLIGWIANTGTLFLGKISYSLYLIHQYFSLRILIPSLMDAGLPHLHACIVSLLIVIITAAGFAYFIEYPLHDKIRAYLKRNTTKV
ncbi:acyltransferase [Mucilaginibacter limnophilus]|uniref:Acyltransferase n=1 Tax=Mucilaginibacter limnophilus TaxID=1932778 RepID=A0A437MV59_9SPHI|nr:acyltransferase [Mucilaginibacter limnophilus]RVU01506.1 acyltransferase [Mucilaginibacter limnophilus]